MYKITNKSEKDLTIYRIDNSRVYNGRIADNLIPGESLDCTDDQLSPEILKLEEQGYLIVKDLTPQKESIEKQKVNIHLEKIKELKKKSQIEKEKVKETEETEPVKSTIIKKDK